MLIIGDIHGCYETLKTLLTQFPHEKDIYSVGDLIDRGPKSREVVQLAIDRGIKAVRGNHEDMLLDYMNKGGVYGGGTFLYNGGDETLKAYGGLDNIPEEHIKYFKEMPLYYDLGRYFISHAGMGWGLSLEESCSGDMPDILWNRGGVKQIESKIQIIGHTPRASVWYEENHCINIDTGCVYPQYGLLTALSIDKEGNRTIISIPYRG